MRVALLDQFRDFGSANTVWEGGAQGYRELIALEQSIHDQGAMLAELGERLTEEQLARYGHDQETFLHSGGDEYHARVDAVLQGLGFDAEESKSRALATLSGGERGRVALAAQLAAPADLVLLDEPTNHLDLDTIAWLQRYLSELGETVLVISHDRAFLDDTVDHVLHVAHGTTTAYRGGYSSFVTQRAERQLTLERQVSQQRRQIAREEDYIRRNIAGQNSAQAKGRRARLARLPRLSAPPGAGETMSVRFDVADRGGDQVVVADKLGVRVGERKLVTGFSAVARRGDAIALVGPNGAGKTTLLATLLGARAPQAGEARLGGGIAPEWFRQDLADLPANRSLYDCVGDRRPMWGRGQIQGLLGAFGFSGDEVQRSTSQLSGGERARLALALMTLRRANLLVLDEPTNHLDVESIEALEDALEEYEGTIILVSHDRAFLRELSTRVWAFEGDRVVDFNGPFVEWEEALSRQRSEEIRSRRVASVSASSSGSRKASKSQRQTPDGRRKDRSRGKARAGRELRALEEAVYAAEQPVSELEAALADPALYDGSAESARRAGDLTRRLAALRAELDRAIAEWTRAVEVADSAVE
jgi:ATP-binding cassette subfamily F protein 3